VRRNAKIALGLAAFAGFALSGCQKPPPSITLWTHGESNQLAPLCWSFESAGLDAGECTEGNLRDQLTSDSGTMDISAENTLGISVDQEVADAGWTPVVNGNPLTSEPLTATYFRFTYPLGAPAEGIPLQVVAGQNQTPMGVWSIRLLPKGS
jgi:hypothetical protein